MVENSLREHWEYPAFSDYHGETYTFEDFGERIARVQLLFEAAKVEEGDKVAIVGKNSSGWAMNFYSILCYGAVAVPILSDFKPTSIHHIINHSKAKVLFVSNSIWENLDIAQLENLNLVLKIDDLKILYAKRKKMMTVPDLCDFLLLRRFPQHLGVDDLHFHRDEPDELAVINYTSGTSGFSKGVMVPYRSIWSNTAFCIKRLNCLGPGLNIVSILPMAHMYGLAIETFYPTCVGAHIHFLTRTPSPRIIAETFSEYSPAVIISVPLILEKIVKKKIFPILHSRKFQLLSKIPFVRERIYRMIAARMTKSLGNSFYEVIVGGAALNKEVEKILRLGHFRYTVGYGMTECGPLISYESWDKIPAGSVGCAVDGMEIKIDSADPENIVGEILTRGDNVMLGYYNNEAATRAVMTEDGWLRTGDLGTIDEKGYLYIRGRSKNMLLGPNGQNIYPEEIEGVLNNMPYVGESLVVSRQDKLVALIHPDLERMDIDGVSAEMLHGIMEQNIKNLNAEISSYSQVCNFQLYQDEFEKTPKRSIKRYMYQ